MKKLIAMIATVAVVLSMGVTSLAAAVDKTQPEGSPDPEKIAAKIVDNEDIIVEIEEYESLPKDVADKLAEKVEDGQIARVFWAYVDGIPAHTDADGALVDYEFVGATKLARESGGAFQIAFTFDGTENVKAVYVYSDGDWADVIDWEIKDGKVIVKSADNGTFAFVITPDDSAAADDAKTDDAKKKSAATGYNSTAYIVCAIALAAGAAFFFGTSKKSAKEMM